MSDLTKYKYDISASTSDLSTSLLLRRLTLADVAEICSKDEEEGSSYQCAHEHEDFTKTKNLAHARDLMINGDLDLLNKANFLLDQLEGSFVGSDNMAINRVYSPAARIVDRGRFKAGDPMPCYRNRDRLGESTRLTCTVNLSCSGGIAADALLANGVAVLSVIRSLELLGYSIRLFVGNFTETGRYKHTDLVLVKDYDGYVDHSVLAFWVAHPSALRRINFRIRDHNPDPIRRTMGYCQGGGYGSRYNPTADQIRDILETDLFFGYLNSYSTKPSEHLDNIFAGDLGEQLKSYGLTNSRYKGELGNHSQREAA